MTKQQEILNLFKKLEFLKFPPQTKEQWQNFVNEFIVCDIDYLKKAIDYIYSTEENFPRPAVVWRIYKNLKPLNDAIWCYICNELKENCIHKSNKEK